MLNTESSLPHSEQKRAVLVVFSTLESQLFSGPCSILEKSNRLGKNNSLKNIYIYIYIIFIFYFKIFLLTHQLHFTRPFDTRKKSKI
jgi:hypothetical protein